MKKFLLGFIVAVTAMVMMTVGVLADTATVNGITWIYTVSDGEAEIYGDAGDDTPAIPGTTTGAITIPSSLGDYPVTSIGDRAFYDCDGLTSVTIPNSVTSIEAGAFKGCSGLERFIVGSNNPSYKSVNGLLLSKDGKTLIAGINGDVVIIPDSVTSIGSRVFRGCRGLERFIVGSNNPSYKSVNGLLLSKDGKTLIAGINGDVVIIPDSVTSIGEDAFYYCSDSLFDTTTIPGVKLVDGWVVGYTDECPSVLDLTGVRGIGDYAFYVCDGLTSVTIPDSVTSIGDSAFEYCSGLTSVTIGNSVTSIGDGAFYCCEGLTSVTIPDSVTSIGGYAFGYCSGLTSVTIGNSVTSIGDGAFSDCSGLTNVTIPDSVTSIGRYAFGYCSGLTNVTIPDSVTSIGDSAFSGCSGLTSVTIGNSVTSIGDGAFSGCSGLTSVTIGNSVTSIGDYAFGYCDLLKSVIFLGDAPRDVGDMVFNYCADDFVIKVKKGTKGWNGDPNSTELPETWQGYPIAYDTESELNVTYKVVFNANGGYGTMSDQSMTYNNAAYLNNNAFNRTGYTFQGWAKSKTGTVAYKNGALVKNLATSGTVALYAVWKPNTYNVAFNANGGSGSMSAQTMGYDTLTKLRANAFNRTGYTFQGWAKSKTGTVAYKNGVSVKNLASSGTVTLFAVWKPNTYKVAFNANGGSGTMLAQTMGYDTLTKLRANAFKRTGYTFLGWAKTKTGAVAYKNAAAVKNLRSTAGTVTLYAKWAKTKYKIAFYANGGTGSMSAQSMTYNKAAYLKKNTFKRTGYTFQGWAKTKTGSVVYTNGKAVKNLTATGGTVKLYAKWKPISYKVVFYGYGGKGSMSAQTIPVNKAAYLKKNAFKRTGYTFAGWAKTVALAKKGKVAYKNRQAVKNLLKKSGTVKLIAVWKPITYKVAFYPNGGTGKAFAQNMTYNKAAYLSKNTFKRTGYIFLGWAKTKNGAVAYKNAQAVKNLRSTSGAIKLYAVWAKTKYKVAFYANGGTGSMSAQSMTYNKAAYLKKNAFKRTGYTFAGWAKTPTGSIVYTNGRAVKNLTTTGATVKLYAVWKPVTK